MGWGNQKRRGSGASWWLGGGALLLPPPARVDLDRRVNIVHLEIDAKGFAQMIGRLRLASTANRFALGKFI